MRPLAARIELDHYNVVSAEPAEITTIVDQGTEYHYPGLYVFPSFVESHAHIMGLGEQLTLPDISVAKSFEELLEIARTTDFRKGNWLFLRGWDESNWPKMPEKPISALDELFPDIPVAIVRVDGHAMFVNSKAIADCGVDLNENVEGGSFSLGKNGKFNGIVIDNAMQPFYDAIPEYSSFQLQQMIGSSIDDFMLRGVTEIHDMDVYLRYIPIYTELAKNGVLPIPVRAYIRAFDGAYKEKYPLPFAVENYEVCGLKFYADGALGSRGALLLGDYADMPGEIGLQLMDNKELYREVYDGCRNGWEIAIHAIGDGAVRNVLDVYEKIRKKGFLNVLRIEHSQIVDKEDIARYKELDVIASVQPIHCTSDSKMASDRLGDRMKNAYPWKSLLKAGAEIIAGSDSPIESNSVLEGLNSFVHRTPKRHTDNWYADEKISLTEALKAYTSLPRYHFSPQADMDIFEQIVENSSFILLDNDFENTDSDSILGTRIYASFTEGNFVYLPKKGSSSQGNPYRYGRVFRGSRTEGFPRIPR